MGGAVFSASLFFCGGVFSAGFFGRVYACARARACLRARACVRAWVCVRAWAHGRVRAFICLDRIGSLPLDRH